MNSDMSPTELILAEELALAQATIVQLRADKHALNNTVQVLQMANRALSERVANFERASEAPPEAK